MHLKYAYYIMYPTTLVRIFNIIQAVQNVTKNDGLMALRAAMYQADISKTQRIIVCETMTKCIYQGPK
jgi:hypothetical protein